MKVLVARPDTDRLTPTRDGDFNWTTPYEVLTMPALVCEGPPEHARNCGCDRSFSGLASGKATTFGIVAEMDDADVRRAVAESETVGSWRSDDFDADEVFMDDLRALAEELEEIPVGAEARIFSTPNDFKLETAWRKEKVT